MLEAAQAWTSGLGGERQKQEPGSLQELEGREDN